METFGDRLRTERQERGLSIEAVAEILQVDQVVLRALERNEFAALPDEAVMMDCLHGYAECLEVEADLMIEDYLQERKKSPSRLEDEILEPAAEPVASASHAEAVPRSRLPYWLVALGAVAVAAFGVWSMLARDETAPSRATQAAVAPVEPPPLSSEPPAAAAPTPAETPGAAAATAAQPPVAVAPTEEAPPPPASRPGPSPTAVSSLSIPEFGVGTAVENRRLVGESSSFRRGTRVCFWTRVEGGRGRRIVHVWLRDGVESSRKSLEIGGASWRTYSARTLPGDAGGSWAVEARDEAGRVLARSEFTSR